MIVDGSHEAAAKIKEQIPDTIGEKRTPISFAAGEMNLENISNPRLNNKVTL